jgi:hypothetical protein
MKRRAATALLVALALLGILACALAAMRQPAAGGDYVAIWGLKARALSRSGSLASLAHVDPTSLASHPEYPPLWPALLALFSRPGGDYDDLRVTLLWPLLCSGAALLAFGSTRADAPSRALAAAAAALLPYWRDPLYVGYAEGLLVLLLLGAVLAARSPRRDALLFVLLLLAALTKQEGALFAVAVAVVLAAARRFRGAGLALSAALLGVVPFTLFISAHLEAGPRRDFALHAFAPAHAGTSLVALARNAGIAGLAWLFGGALLLALAPRAVRANRGLLCGVGIYALALVAAFAFSTRDVDWHVRWTWDRLALVPVVLLLPVLAEAAGEALRREA